MTRSAVDATDDQAGRSVETSVEEAATVLPETTERDLRPSQGERRSDADQSGRELGEGVDNAP